jgi:hypothetical protein
MWCGVCCPHPAGHSRVYLCIKTHKQWPLGALPAGTPDQQELLGLGSLKSGQTGSRIDIQAKPL